MVLLTPIWQWSHLPPLDSVIPLTPIWQFVLPTPHLTVVPLTPTFNPQSGLLPPPLPFWEWYMYHLPWYHLPPFDGGLQERERQGARQVSSKCSLHNGQRSKWREEKLTWMDAVTWTHNTHHFMYTVDSHNYTWCTCIHTTCISCIYIYVCQIHLNKWLMRWVDLHAKT